MYEWKGQGRYWTYQQVQNICNTGFLETSAAQVLVSAQVGQRAAALHSPPLRQLYRSIATLSSPYQPLCCANQFYFELGHFTFVLQRFIHSIPFHLPSVRDEIQPHCYIKFTLWYCSTAFPLTPRYNYPVSQPVLSGLACFLPFLLSFHSTFRYLVSIRSGSVIL